MVTRQVCGDGGTLMLSVELIEAESGRRAWSIALAPDDSGVLDPERAAEEVARRSAQGSSSRLVVERGTEPRAAR